MRAWDALDDVYCTMKVQLIVHRDTSIAALTVTSCEAEKVHKFGSIVERIQYKHVIDVRVTGNEP